MSTFLFLIKPTSLKIFFLIIEKELPLSKKAATLFGFFPTIIKFLSIIPVLI